MKISCSISMRKNLTALILVCIFESLHEHSATNMQGLAGDISALCFEYDFDIKTTASNIDPPLLANLRINNLAHSSGSQLFINSIIKILR